MNPGAFGMFVVIAIVVGVTAYLVGTLVRAIQNEKKTRMRVWKNFGLSLGFCGLFFITWIAQGLSQWQVFTDQQREHGEIPEVGDFVAELSQATLENWQSEFLQLFSFTVMAAVLIHKGSAESKDSDDRIQAALMRIEEKLETEPVRPQQGVDQQDLHVIPDEAQGWQLRGTGSSEPEGYYDKQDEAIAAGRELARKKNVSLHVHGTDGSIRESTSHQEA